MQGCPKQFPSITSLLVHHSIMPEVLPVPLSLNRYNPTFRPAENSNGNDKSPDSDRIRDENGDDTEHRKSDMDADYLDPDNDSVDYELISRLRQGLTMSPQISTQHKSHRQLVMADIT